MNKEVEKMNKRLARMLIEDKQNMKEHFLNKIEQLQAKVNQLETNIEEAIEFVQKTQFDCGDFNCCGFGIWKNGKNELLEILERGKE